MDIKFIEREVLKEKPSSDLGFGKYTTDYMFVMEWDQGRAWHDQRIQPYGPIEFDPASMVLHYAQETFEGMKAYMNPQGQAQLFRPEMNAKRFQNSNQRMAMPIIEVDDFIQAIEELVQIEKEWIPTGEEESLYIRPFMYATEASIGVHASNSYIFMVILSPVGAYYESGLEPVKIYVEDEYVRATQGGTGFVKCGGNYAGSLAAQVKAEDLGYTQVLWLDGMTRENVEEVGSMNVMFLIDGTIVTPPVNGTVLPGVTRDSILHILKDKGYKIEERVLPIEELMDHGRNGRLEEAWGTGTAAVVSPIGELYFKGENIIVNDGEIGDLTQNLYDTLTGIQWGKIEDPYGWVYKIK